MKTGSFGEEEERKTINTPSTNLLNSNCLWQVPALKEAIENVDSLSATLREKQSLLSDEIAATFDQIVGIVEKRRADVVRQLGAREGAKQATLAKQKEELETSLADLYTTCEFVEKALEHGSETEVLLVKKQVGFWGQGTSQ